MEKYIARDEQRSGSCSHYMFLPLAAVVVTKEFGSRIPLLLFSIVLSWRLHLCIITDLGLGFVVAMEPIWVGLGIA
jgi:hypothetical protein